VIVLPFENKTKYLERYSQPDKIEFGMDREENWPVPFWTVDTGMAILLILLAAVDAGLGAWYFGITNGEEEVTRRLGVPDGSKLMGVIALGYPAADEKPRGSVFARRRRAFEDMFHFGKW
jgi:nitroreductase